MLNNKLSICIALALGIASMPIFAKPAATVDHNTSVTPVAGTATVDGDISEWNISNGSPDFSANMCTAGSIGADGNCEGNGKVQLSTMYSRYDCATNTMYVMVLREGEYWPNKSASDAWVKIYDLGQSPQVDGNSSTFSWVSPNGVEGSTLIGYEASFTLAAGTYSDVQVHLNVDSNTSSTGKIDDTMSITVGENCSMPEEPTVPDSEEPTAPEPETGNPNVSCPAGTELMAKFEWNDGGYVFEKPEGNDSIVTIDGNEAGGSWTSTGGITHVILKGGTETNTAETDSANGGDFTKDSIPANGGGQTPDISNIQFCGLTACSYVYGVHDRGLNDSIIFKYSDATGFSQLGEVHNGADIEGLDISPDGVMYASAGDDTSNPGAIYTVDMVTGALDRLKVNDPLEIDGISFNPITGILNGWAQDVGLLTIDSDTGEVTLPTVGYNGEVEDISWSNDGSTLYFIDSEHGNNDPDAASDKGVKQTLRSYTPAGGISEAVCGIQGPEIEAIEVLQDNTLLVGYHENGNQMVKIVNPDTCEVTFDGGVDGTPYNDIEGLAVCPPIQD